MKPRRLHLLLCLLGLALCLIPFRARVRSAIRSAASQLNIAWNGTKTVSDRVVQYGDAVHNRLAARFKEVGVAYPPKRITLVGLKQERAMEVWVSDESGEFRLLETFPILGASGILGPKLAEGDAQVPEGLYTIESLNPNSLFHLALRVGYPNNFDKTKGKLDGRAHLGSDIMIHGGDQSIGCLAMGDPVAEDLFVLAAETGIERIAVILSPVDFRIRGLPPRLPPMPSWTPELYAQIQDELHKLKKQPVAATGAVPAQ